MERIDSLRIEMIPATVKHLLLLFPGKAGITLVEQKNRLKYIHQVLGGSLLSQHLLCPQGARCTTDTPGKLAAHQFLAACFMEPALCLSQDLILRLVELGVIEPLFCCVYADVGPAFGAHFIVESLHVCGIERKLIFILGCQARCQYIKIVKQNLHKGGTMTIGRFAELTGKVIGPGACQNEYILSALEIDAFLNNKLGV